MYDRKDAVPNIVNVNELSQKIMNRRRGEDGSEVRRYSVYECCGSEACHILVQETIL